MNITNTEAVEKTDARPQFCPNLECVSREQIGQGNIVGHGSKRPRYKYKTCVKTFSANAVTALAGLRKPTELIVVVITLLAYGCPTQAIVRAFGLDERTVADWQYRAGKHYELVHKEKARAYLFPRKGGVLIANHFPTRLCTKNLLCDCARGVFVHPPDDGTLLLFDALPKICHRRNSGGGG